MGGAALLGERILSVLLTVPADRLPSVATALGTQWAAGAATGRRFLALALALAVATGAFLLFGTLSVANANRMATGLAVGAQVRIPLRWQPSCARCAMPQEVPLPVPAYAV